MSLFETIAASMPRWRMARASQAVGTSNTTTKAALLPVGRPTLQLVKADMAAFRQGCAEARRAGGSRRQLQAFYERILIDAHLCSVMQQRRLATMGRPFALQGPDGKGIPAAKACFAGPWFGQFCSHALEAVFYGFSLVQLGEALADGGFASATAVARHLLHPDEGTVEAASGKRVAYGQEPWAGWAIPCGDGAALGLMEQAVPLVLAKQQALAAWSAYLDLFGTPMRLGKVAIEEPGTAERMARALETMGTASWAVFDHEDQIEFLQAKQASSGQEGYERLARFADEQLSKLVLGQTMTTESGSSLAQAEVHERVGQAVARADERYLEGLINAELLPRMARLGMPVTGVTFLFLPDEQALPASLKLELLKTLLPTLPPTPAWIEAEFGVELQRSES